MMIKNFDQLAKTKERKLAIEIIEAGLDAIDTRKIVRETVSLIGDELRIGNEKFPLGEIERLFVVGVGKCSLAAAAVLEEILDDRITDGIVVDVRSGELNKIRTISGDHPFPSEKNMDATKDIIKFLSDATERDFVIFIISGGGSTLLCQPEDLTCLDETNILKCLFGASAGIKKINTVRKHLSSARGGHLAKYAYPAKAVSLIFSDVPGDDLEFIASGPTIKDTTTVADARKILEECDVENHINLPKITLIETPKDDKYFENVKNILVVSNKIALVAMREKAKSEGFSSEIINTTLGGEARDVAIDIIKKLHKAKNGTIHLYGGETTVTVAHPGKGGRNLELALSALNSVEDGELVVSFASDGRDNTDFAGAISDMITRESSDKLGLNAQEYLDKNNSYEFFNKTGDYIKTGDTGRNVADFVIAIKS